MLQINAVPTRTMDILKLLASQPCLESFYLVGGTALSLQIGHRLSYDLDFFSSGKNDLEMIQNELLQLDHIRLKTRSDYALFMEYESIKIDILNYGYRFIYPPVSYGNIKLANLKDIAAMKLKTIMNRGAKRDFYDIYFLLEVFSLEYMLELFRIKYENIEPIAIYKSLCYFEDAEGQEDPILLVNTALTWERVKNRMIQETKNLL